MDLATIIGFAVAIGAIAFGIVGHGGPENFKLFADPVSATIVIGGAFGAVCIAFPLEHVISSFKVAMFTVFHPSKDLQKLIGTLVSMAEKARREGLLALEEQVAGIDDLFFKNGVQLVVDGTEPEMVRSILEIELAFLEERHSMGKKLFEQLGALSPAYGMIGTLTGLVMMLAHFNDPSAIGPGMSLALVTTFFGALMANVFWIPMAHKLGVRSAEEVLYRQLMVEGILAIQRGENPRMVEQKLKSFLAPKMRERMASQSAAPAEEAA